MAEIRWTDEQVAAITAPGDVMLAASAGTGKTTTIVGRVLWLLGLPVGVRASDGAPVPPSSDPCSLEEVAAITFTEKAAHDLKAKLRREIVRADAGGGLRWEIDRASIGTIHSFCGELLREHALRLGIDPGFRILDERETRLRQDEVVREVVLEGLRDGEPAAVEAVKRFGVQREGFASGTVDHVRSAMRDVRWRPGRYGRWAPGGELDVDALCRLAVERGILDPDGDPAADRRALEDTAALQRLARRCLEKWHAWLAEENVRDFDSLVLDARRLLEDEAAGPALEGLRRRYRALIIDEFQDTDAAQRDIAFAIAGLGAGSGPAARRPALFLVGDPKQSIYGFRGADVSVWNAVAGELCGSGGPLRLTRNFRSEPAVVRFVNRVGGRALGESARALAAEAPGTEVGYTELVAARPPTRAAGLEWLPNDAGSTVDEHAEEEARRVASRIREMVDARTPVIDPQREVPRACAWRDIAVLGRKRANLTALEAALRAYGIPYYNTATAGLSERQEVLDLVTVLRLLENPRDDLRAFAYLRSPFVGLRDEVLARIRLDPHTGRTPFLRQAERFLEAVEAGDIGWFAAPEGPRIEAVERDALAAGLEAIRAASELVDRADPPELLESVLEKTGYRLHLMLRPAPEVALANIERFLALLEEYRHLSLGSFLDLWARWGDRDLGLPQAPLFSQDDDVVTLSTVHTAKGLEWPIVFLVATREGPDAKRHMTYDYVSDRELGPAFMPRKAERGPRCQAVWRRAALEGVAEEARLLYVAMTRARDRLVVSGPTGDRKGFATWLGPELEDAVDVRSEEGGPGTAAASGTPPPRPSAAGSSEPDAATGTGRQIDAFGFDEEPEDGDGQLSLFAVRPAAAAGSGPGGVGAGRDAADGARRPELEALVDPAFAELPVLLRRETADIQTRLDEPPISLAWLEGIEVAPEPPGVRPIEVERRSFLTSATELMTRERDPDDWALRYRHGVEPAWRFAPGSGDREGLAPELRGQLIHGVLEEIREAREIAELLNQTIAGIDAPELEELLEPESDYRAALEREIERVVGSPEWRWYVEPPHDPDLHRELRFVHLVGRREWRQGAFDLYRPPGREGNVDEAGLGRGRHPWIVDFKTHRIAAGEVSGKAGDYAIQARVYREAAEALLPAARDGDGARPVRVALHFTHPNVAVEV